MTVSYPVSVHTRFIVVLFATIAGAWVVSPGVLAQTVQSLPDSNLEQLPEGPNPYENLSLPELLQLIQQELRSPMETPTRIPPEVQPAPPCSECDPVETTDRLKRYRLGPNDVILITVARFPDFNFQGPINPEGAIVLPLVNEISLEGLTLGEAQESIRQALDRYIVDPQVSLSLVSQRPVQVTVVGPVTRPGFYLLANPRLSDALAAAGGSLASADLRRVEVRRTLVGGQVLSQTLDLYTPLKAGQPLPNQRLEDGDVVVLQELQSLDDPNYDRRLVAISTLAKPTISIRMLSYASNGIGTLNLPAGSSFRDALNGIPLDQANINSIALIRYDPQTRQAVKTSVNGKEVLLGNPDANLALQDNDVIVVGRNLVTQISTLLNRFTQPFRDTLGFLLFFDSLQTSASDLFQSGGRSNN
jgi:polysaccharide biosynthesis/export protein